MTFLRFTLLILLLCVFISEVPAKHIIVAYDTSGSMHYVNKKRRMSVTDLDRLNNYLTQILFVGVPKNVSDNRDEITLALDNGPLYQAGDMLSYFHFDTGIDERFSKQRNVRQTDFVQRLPITEKYKGYQGQNTDIIKAKVHIYDNLYQKIDQMTYWILVSDEDIDLSVGAIKDPRLKAKVAKFERDFFQPPVFELIVNNHVTIRIRKIFRYDQLLPSDSVYTATLQNPNTSAQMVAFSKDSTTGGFRSETLRLDTTNENKGDFQLDRVKAEILSEDGNALHNLRPILLNGISPPKTFRLTLPPGLSTTKNTSNELQITIHYKHNGASKTRKYSVSYKTTIDTLYLALKKQPNQPLDKITFVKEGGEYVNKDPLVLYTESPDVDKFRVIHVGCAVIDKDRNELHTLGMPMDFDKLPALLLPISFPAEKKFENRKNQITLTIDYKYDKSTRDHSIITNYKLINPPSLLPFVVGGVLLGVGLLGAFAWWVYGLVSRGGRTLDITLHETLPVEGEPQHFTLGKGDAISFQSSGFSSPDLGQQQVFDVNCEGYLAYDGKDLSRHQIATDGGTTSITLSDGQEFSLKSTVGDFDVQVRVDFGDGASVTSATETMVDKSEEDDLLGAETAVVDDDDPLNR